MSRSRFMPSLWFLPWWWRWRGFPDTLTVKTPFDCRVESVCWWLAGYPRMGRILWRCARETPDGLR